MAQKVTVQLVDDLDNGPADETVLFSLDGVAYEIDLSKKNASAFRDSLAPYVGPARKLGGRSATGRGPARRPRNASGDNRTAEIREWARKNGHKVNERGRLSGSIVEAFDKAHS